MGWSGQGGSVWIGRGGGLSVMAIPLEDASRESEASELWGLEERGREIRGSVNTKVEGILEKEL